MNVGMLWLIKESTTLNAGIAQAAAYYEKKYGRKPELCLVNPKLMEADSTSIEIAGLTVRPYRPVLPGHLWIGVEEMPESIKDVSPS